MLQSMGWHRGGHDLVTGQPPPLASTGVTQQVRGTSVPYSQGAFIPLGEMGKKDITQKPMLKDNLPLWYVQQGKQN